MAILSREFPCIFLSILTTFQKRSYRHFKKKKKKTISARASSVDVSLKTEALVSLNSAVARCLLIHDRIVPLFTLNRKSNKTSVQIFFICKSREKNKKFKNK